MVNVDSPKQVAARAAALELRAKLEEENRRREDTKQRNLRAIWEAEKKAATKRTQWKQQIQQEARANVERIMTEQKNIKDDVSKQDKGEKKQIEDKITAMKNHLDMVLSNYESLERELDRLIKTNHENVNYYDIGIKKNEIIKYKKEPIYVLALKIKKELGSLSNVRHTIAREIYRKHYFEYDTIVSKHKSGGYLLNHSKYFNHCF
jgi:hypothetical protein